MNEILIPDFVECHNKALKNFLLIRKLEKEQQKRVAKVNSTKVLLLLTTLSTLALMLIK